MEIIKNYVISNRVIGHKLKLCRSILEKNEYTRKRDTLFYKCSEQIGY